VVAPGFDAERAFADLRALVALGPRPPGSDAAAGTRELITTRLRQAGWPVREHSFEAEPPDRDPVAMINLIAELPGAEPGWILFGTHYDTKRIGGVRFVGANDGASGVALLLELARQLATSERPYGVRLLFFDGEEAFGPHITPEDGLYGSRALAEQMHQSGELARAHALVIVDLVADADLGLVDDRNSSPRLRRLLQETASDLGLEHAATGGGPGLIIDDHVSFAESGLTEVLCLIDLRFGDRTMPGPFWHTARDDLGAVSAESLNTVGQLVVEFYKRLAGALQESGATSAP
jgi:hypothetical protein